jgi:hypothetical protein
MINMMKDSISKNQIKLSVIIKIMTCKKTVTFKLGFGY